jgi:predicted phage terminase large subunit-like protein
MTAAGAGGGITGTGAHLFILDDPIKNREEAESENTREALWEWWTSTARTRLEDGAAVVASLTHWHSDDWAGRIISKQASQAEHERWTILWLPAIWETPILPQGSTFAKFQHEQMMQGNYLEENDLLGREEGQALWPEKYDEEDLAVIEKAVEPYNWASLYQQRTYLRSGNWFKREHFTVVDRLPDPDEVLMRGRFWDKAGTKTGTGGDYAAGVLMSITKDDGVYVEHLFFDRCTPMNREEAMKRLGLEDWSRKGPRCQIWHQQDPGSSGLDSAQLTNINLAKAGLTAHFETVSGDKKVRAGPWSSACEAGRVRLIRGAWNEGFIERHVGFDRHPYDDDVDAASWGFLKLSGAASMNPEKMIAFA